MNRKFTDNDSKRKRNKVTRDAAISTRVRVVNDDVGHRLAGLPDSPPLTTVTVTGPTVLVPDDDQRWSFEFKDWSEAQVEQELATLQTAVEAAYSAPAVANVETALLSPPSGTFGSVLFSSLLSSRRWYPRHVVGTHDTSLVSTTHSGVGLISPAMELRRGANKPHNGTE
jgi:hypothetical protein